jgi:hypothetical protein
LAALLVSNAELKKVLMVTALLATHITALGIVTLINYSPIPDVGMIMFVGTCAITFGIGATLTGLAITLTEDPDTTGRE